MFSFQCIYSSFDVQLSSKKAIAFRSYVYQTNDPVIAEELRRKSGKDFWEMPTEKEVDAAVKEATVVEAPVVAEAPTPKKRGRPPKVVVVQGIRTSEVMEANNEGEKQ